MYLTLYFKERLTQPIPVEDLKFKQTGPNGKF